MAKSRYKRKGKAKFLMIDGYIIRSAAWQALSPHDIATYLELKWRYDGLNNGRIGLGCRELAERLKSSKDTALRSLNNLVAKGFIAKSRPSGFNVKNRMATEWRLTEYSCDLSNHLPTKDFMRWPDENKTQARQKDAQAHQKDSRTSGKQQNRTHSRNTGTVKPLSQSPQAHQKDTYSTTIGGSVDAA